MSGKEKGVFLAKKDMFLKLRTDRRDVANARGGGSPIVTCSGDRAVKPSPTDQRDVAKARVEKLFKRIPGLPPLKLVEDYLQGWRRFTLAEDTGPKELLVREERTTPLSVAYVSKGSASSQSHEYILPKMGECTNTDIQSNFLESACKIPGQDESLVSEEESVPHPRAITSVSELPQVKLSRLHELPVASQSETGIPPEAVIAFVNEMERAHQYYKLIEYLFCKIKPDLDPRDVDDLAYELGMQNYNDQKFNLLNMGDIRHVVNGYALELIECKEMENLTDKVLNNDPYAYKNPVFYLVFRTLKKGYVLDTDPIAELNKLQRYTPTFYRDSLICQKSHVEREGRTVIVSNISPDVSGKDVWHFFRTCGDIEHVETDRVSKCQKAYITFRKKSGAKHAQDYTDVKVPHKVRLKGAPLLVEPVAVQNVKGSEFAAKKAEDMSTMLAKAHNKYSELNMYYSKIQKRSIAPEKDEQLGSPYEDGGGWDPSLVKDECWDYCEWMQLEAMANGGFTVGGQSLLHPPPPVVS